MDKPFSTSHVSLVLQVINTLSSLMVHSMVKTTTQERKDSNNGNVIKLVQQPTEQKVS